MRDIDLIVIHCAATPNGRWTSTLDIDHWHKDRGFHRTPEGLAKQNSELTAIGYHWVIYTNGARATGRHASEIGAHAREQRANHRGLGICVVGTDQFTLPQWYALKDQVQLLCAEFKVPRQFANARNGYTGVCGHRDLGAKKTCPGFAVADWLCGGMVPLDGHILEAA